MRVLLCTTLLLWLFLGTPLLYLTLTLIPFQQGWQNGICRVTSVTAIDSCHSTYTIEMAHDKKQSTVSCVAVNARQTLTLFPQSCETLVPFIDTGNSPAPWQCNPGLYQFTEHQYPVPSTHPCVYRCEPECVALLDTTSPFVDWSSYKMLLAISTVPLVYSMGAMCLACVATSTRQWLIFCLIALVFLNTVAIIGSLFLFTQTHLITLLILFGCSQVGLALGILCHKELAYFFYFTFLCLLCVYLLYLTVSENDYLLWTVHFWASTFSSGVLWGALEHQYQTSLQYHR